MIRIYQTLHCQLKKNVFSTRIHIRIRIQTRTDAHETSLWDVQKFFFKRTSHPREEVLKGRKRKIKCRRKDMLSIEKYQNDTSLWNKTSCNWCYS